MYPIHLAVLPELHWYNNGLSQIRKGRWSIEKCAKEYEDFYRKVISEPSYAKVEA